VVTWTTEDHGLAVAALRKQGGHVNDAALARIWRHHRGTPHLYGNPLADIDSELANLDSDRYRPLRGPRVSQAAGARLGPQPGVRVDAVREGPRNGAFPTCPRFTD
jgi:hypothetical protein